MKKYLIKCMGKTSFKDIAKYGTVILEARLWKDEVILETELSLDEVYRLEFVLSARRIA
jgi:hypothetical protein